MSTEVTLTTAAALVSLRKELIEGGFSEHEVEQISRDVAPIIVAEMGLVVRDA